MNTHAQAPSWALMGRRRGLRGDAVDEHPCLSAGVGTGAFPPRSCLTRRTGEPANAEDVNARPEAVNARLVVAWRISYARMHGCMQIGCMQIGCMQIGCMHIGTNSIAWRSSDARMAAR